MSTTLNRRRARAVLAALTVGLLLAGCTSTRSVTRTASDTTTDLSGRWNDTDARLVAEEMVSDVLNRPWLPRFEEAEGRQPVVVVLGVRNLSSQHIDTTALIRDIERELINSGMVRFVAGGAVREAVRTERMDQQTQASEETVRRLGEEVGADFLMRGTISSSVDAVDGTASLFYQVDMELIDIETNEKVWIGSKEIKKIIERRRIRF